MHRLFVAIRPPEDIVDLLVDAMDDGPSLRWVPADNLHLTLRFIGEVERPVAEDIARSLDAVRADRFTIGLSGIGCFQQRSGGALWAGIEPSSPVAALAAKVEQVCKSAGCEPERRAFHPHITLARFGRGSRPNVEPFLRRRVALSSAPFEVAAFTLYESQLSRHGAHYEAIAEFALS